MNDCLRHIFDINDVAICSKVKLSWFWVTGEQFRVEKVSQNRNLLFTIRKISQGLDGIAHLSSFETRDKLSNWQLSNIASPGYEISQCLANVDKERTGRQPLLHRDAEQQDSRFTGSHTIPSGRAMGSATASAAGAAAPRAAIIMQAARVMEKTFMLVNSETEEGIYCVWWMRSVCKEAGALLGLKESYIVKIYHEVSCTDKGYLLILN